jgi:SAM-dependent methyltransferase
MDFTNNFADLVIMNDFIHSNDVNTKMPIRFIFFEEAYRVLKNGGILSIAPFDCEFMRDRNGKKRKYSHEQIISEIENYGFDFLFKQAGAIHFEKYHSIFLISNLFFFDFFKIYITLIGTCLACPACP